MCEPATIAVASLGIAAASAGTSYLAASEQAAAQGEANEKAFDSAVESATGQYSSIDEQTAQAIAQAGAEITEVKRQGKQARATTTLSAVEGGLDTSSGAVQALLMDAMQREMGYEVAQGRNIDDFIDQQAANKRGVASGAQSRINSLPLVTAPSFIQPLLSVAGAATSAYGTYGDQMRQIEILSATKKG